MSLVLAICLISGVVIGIFAVWPLLLPILAAVGIAVFLIWRHKRKGRGIKR
jgi:hypothetical protein